MRIKQLGDPILRTISKQLSVEDINSPETTKIITTMKNTLDGIQSISKENGNALSAPQVGYPIRLILLRIDSQFIPMINPHIVEASSESFMFDEECFSAYNIRASVSRHQSLQVEYHDEHAKVQKITAHDELAGLIQHEVDHLDGVIFLDRVEDNHTLASIDFIYKNDPNRLTQVKEMINYMVGS